MAKRELYLQWDSTDACQLKCLHCYHGHEGNPNHAVDSSEMEVPEVLKMLDDLKDTADSWGMYPKLRISGGEPLLRKNLFDILAHSKDREIPTGLLTNGNLIDEKVAKKLIGYGVNRVQISLDGKKDRHNFIRQSQTAYDLALRGIKNSKDAGIEVTVSMTAMKSNKEEFEDVVKTAISSGATRVGFQSYVPSKDLGTSDPEYLNKRDTFDLFRETENLSEKYKDKINVLRTEVLWQILQKDNPIKKDARD